MWLALETATDRASVAVGESVADAVEECITGPRRHAGALLPMVQRALWRRDATLDQITGILLSDGPGSFTGLRVGAAVAKGLVHARGLPLRVAPSLMVRAVGAAPADGSLVIAVADALRGEVYAGGFRFETGQVIVELPAAVHRPAELGGLGLTPDHLVGDVPDGVAAELERWAGRKLVRSPGGAARAESLIALATRAGGTRAVSEVTTWEPEYGRPAEAQARWESLHGRPLPDPAGDPR